MKKMIAVMMPLASLASMVSLLNDASPSVRYPDEESLCYNEVVLNAIGLTPKSRVTKPKKEV